MKYEILKGEEISGPFTINQLRHMWNSGQITINAAYRNFATQEWHPISEIESLLDGQTVREHSPHHSVVQTIQATSKGWKALQMISALAAIFGAIQLGINLPLGIIFLIGGIFFFCIARIGAWWFHA